LAGCFAIRGSIRWPFYLDKAVQAVPSSRDVWTLRGWACVGSGDRGQAIESFLKAVSLPGATEGDRETLAALESGADLAQLRKDLVLRKFDDEVLRGKHGDPKEAARSGVVQFKQLLEKSRTMPTWPTVLHIATTY